jgi:hypothetical protein
MRWRFSCDEVVGEVVPLVGVGDDVLDVEERRGGALVEAVEELGDVVLPLRAGAEGPLKR